MRGSNARLGLWVVSALCLPAAASADAPARVLLLPAQGEDGVRERHVERLQDALDTAQEARGKDDESMLTLPRRALRKCRDDMTCLSSEGRRIGAQRSLETRLGDDGDQFHITTTVRDLGTGEVLKQTPHKVSRYRLRSLGEGIMEQAFKEAGRPKAELVGEPQPRARGAGDDDDADDGARGQPVHSSAPGYRDAPTTLKDAMERAERDRLPPGAEGGPLPGTEAGEALAAKRAARERNPDSFKGLPESDGPASTWSQRHEHLKALAQSKQGREQAILIGIYMLLAMVSFGIGFGGMSVIPAFGRAARRRFSSERTLSVKETAQNLALLRSCCKQLTPGIIMSTEFETTRHFHFALLDGKTVSINVTDYEKADKSAFRPGAMLCAQFSHDDRACICMMVVRKARMTRGFMRVTLEVPEQLADIVLPRRFHIPVPDAMGLLAQVALNEGKEKLSFMTRVAEISSDGLLLKVDSDTPKLPTSCTLDVSLRSTEDRADVKAKFEGLEDRKLVLTVLPELGGQRPNHAFGALFKKIEVAWVAPKPAA